MQKTEGLRRQHYNWGENRLQLGQSDYPGWLSKNWAQVQVLL